MSSRVIGDRYRIVNVLGRGSYGAVYHATAGSKNFAIKEVSLKQPTESLWEISLSNLMSHPSIMKPYEFIADDKYETIAIVMPEAQSNLSRAIYSGIDINDIRLLSWQILSAVDYMHSNSIVHRDIKPDNILLNDLQVFIIDFGLARFLNQDIGSTSIVIQTSTHRAPEVYKETISKSTNSVLGSSIDMWSVGMIILEMFLGKVIFARKSESEIASVITTEDHPMRSYIDTLKVDSQIKDLLTGLLVSDPSQRLSAKQAMQSPWFSNLIYQEPERISYPHVVPMPDSSGAREIRDAVSSLIEECGYPHSVYDQALLLTKMIFTNQPSFFGHERRKYYPILMKIAAIQIVEYKSEITRGCGLAGVNKKDLYDVFRALNYNIIVI